MTVTVNSHSNEKSWRSQFNMFSFPVQKQHEKHSAFVAETVQSVQEKDKQVKEV